MKYFLKLALTVLIGCSAFLSLPTQIFAEAAPTATMRIDVKIEQSDIFWNSTYLTRDSDFGKPVAINLTWGIGDSKRQEQTQLIVSPGQTKGRLEITAEKGALVNFQVSVVDADKAKHGTLSFQVKNAGQTEYVTIAPPESSEPQLTFGAPKQ